MKAARMFYRKVASYFTRNWMKKCYLEVEQVEHAGKYLCKCFLLTSEVVKFAIPNL